MVSPHRYFPTKGSFATKLKEYRASGLDIVSKGEGTSKQEAEQQAAKNFLTQLKQK